MGHEVVEFRNAQQTFDMHELQVAFALLSHHGNRWLQENDPHDEATRKLLDGWLQRLSMTDAFFEPQFNEYVQSVRDRERLLLIIDATKGHVQEAKGGIPADLLNQILGFKGIGSFTKAIATESVLLTLQRIRELLANRPM